MTIVINAAFTTSINAAILATATDLGYFRVKSNKRRDEVLTSTLEDLKLEETFYADALKVVEEERARIEAERALAKASKDAGTKRAERKEQENLAKPIEAVSNVHEAIVKLPEGKYVLTVAQNNSVVDEEFFGALKNYCVQNDVTLLVAKMSYNKNAFQQDLANESLIYPSALNEYYVEGHISLGESFHFIANANVLPTAKHPLTGFEGITKAGVNAVVPASKISLKCCAALKGSTGKVLFSTGAITKPNYILRKAGTIAAQEHNIGALFIDTSLGLAGVRQLEQMEGFSGFFDEGKQYTSDNMFLDKLPAALQLGDIHAEKVDEECFQGALDVIGKYSPAKLVLHDLMDFSSRNHHNVKDCSFMFKQHMEENSVRGDVDQVAHILDTLCDAMEGYDIHVVESNHDLAVDTWLNNADFKQDPTNALFYLETMTAKFRAISNGESFNTLEYLMREAEVSEQVQFLSTDQSLMIAGVEMGNHGHNGVNGAKGSPIGFRALGVPMNTGHTHTPQITGGVYTAGVTGSLEMGYNKGASSWKLAHIVTWSNGQRQVIFQ